MSNKQIIREIKVNKREYVIEISVGVMAIMISFFANLDKFTYFGFPADIAFLIIGILAIVVGIIQLSKSKSASPIYIYKDSIEHDGFSSSLDDLIVQKYKRSLRLMNADGSKEINFTLSKPDYHYLLGL